ncbi:hypothetical protein PISMIDRAFT_576937 [Pisolithus microcarpus 441]|uniref:CCHC-type domain-containing protein n=1 Tax=Pisolithus microcarpus 441 TaxID=765257 RepID=A0A0C9XEL3_9AGAM|nr:hypothetical protein PISMIDRAFT_576937 [Pisolithus microcarpus 441]
MTKSKKSKDNNKKNKGKKTLLFSTPLTHSGFQGEVSVVEEEQGTSRKVELPTCHECGEVGHVRRNCGWWLQNQTCYQCFKLGHLAVNCPKTVCRFCHQAKPGHVDMDCPVIAPALEWDGRDDVELPAE